MVAEQFGEVMKKCQMLKLDKLLYAENEILRATPFHILNLSVQVMEMEAITRAARLGRTLGQYNHHHDYRPLWQYHDHAIMIWNHGTILLFISLSLCLFVFFRQFVFCVFVFGNDNFDNRILPPNGVPGAGRAAEDGDGLPRRLRRDARLHRQLRLHLTWLDHPPPPLSYTWTKCLPIGQKLLWPYTHNNNSPIYPAAQSNHVHYVNLNVIMTAIVFHRISNCWYMSSIVFCSGRLFGKRMWGFLKNQGGFFSHLCIKSRLVVGFWDFWELFLSPYKCYCYLHF